MQETGKTQQQTGSRQAADRQQTGSRQLREVSRQAGGNSEHRNGTHISAYRRK
jgi:hypothetical protein